MQRTFVSAWLGELSAETIRKKGGTPLFEINPPCISPYPFLLLFIPSFLVLIFLPKDHHLLCAKEKKHGGINYIKKNLCELGVGKGFWV